MAAFAAALCRHFTKWCCPICRRDCFGSTLPFAIVALATVHFAFSPPPPLCHSTVYRLLNLQCDLHTAEDKRHLYFSRLGMIILKVAQCSFGGLSKFRLSK